MDNLTDELENLLKVLADNTRLRIIELLKSKKMYAKGIQKALDKSQSTISQQLGILLEADLIEYEKDGKKNLYSIKSPQILKILASIQRFIIDQKKEKLKSLRSFDIYDTLF
jgi:ArsR family transcriptional regulator